MTQRNKKDRAKDGLKVLTKKYQTLKKYSMYRYMFKTIIKVIGHHACFQATEGGKITHILWIIQGKSIIM